MMALGPALALALVPGGRHRLDVPLPPAPREHFGHGDALVDGRLPRTARKPGTPTTLFVNFDGVDLGHCNPSNSIKNCHWYNDAEPIPAFSGSLQTKVSILQAMRRHADMFGVRITGVRPRSGHYTMLVYGGTEAQYGALGSAPSGDCYDGYPDEIGFVHLDGELVDWVVAGATTSLHEAAHTWGLDHVDLETEIMYPEGDNTPTAFDDACHGIVADVDLTPGEPSCPELNDALCSAPDRQDSVQALVELFGPPYVDETPPTIELVAPHDGAYFQAPGEFEVELELDDDLHPQAYAMWAWLDGEARPAEPNLLVAPGFDVEGLPVGHWRFHVAIADEAGNEATLSFEVEVGVDPPPEPQPPQGCALGPVTPARAPLLAALPLLLAVARRKR